MRALWCAVILLAACGEQTNNDDSGVDVDTGDSGEIERYAFEAGTLEGCSTDTISWNKWTYQHGEPEATWVFVNGRTEYTDKYHHLIDLVDRPWNIIMYDHYGQGRSGGVRAHADAETDGFQGWGCDLGRVLDAHADPELPIVATTMENPDRIAGYVLGSPLVKAPESEDVSSVQACSFAAMNVANGFEENPYQGAEPRPEDCIENETTHDCELYQQFYDDPLTLIGPPTWGWIDQVCKSSDILFETGPASVQRPVLIMQAGIETTVTPAHQDDFCAALNEAEADSCEIRVWEDNFHELYMELDREEIMAETLEFLDARLAE